MTNSRRTSHGPVPGRGLAVEKHWNRGTVHAAPDLYCWSPN